MCLANIWFTIIKTDWLKKLFRLGQLLLFFYSQGSNVQIIYSRTLVTENVYDTHRPVKFQKGCNWCYDMELFFLEQSGLNLVNNEQTENKLHCIRQEYMLHICRITCILIFFNDSSHL